MIPEHVAAYVAGLRLASKVIKGRALSWRVIARLLEQMGTGSFEPGELQMAALAWAVAHVEPAAVRLALKRDPLKRLRKAGRSLGAASRPKKDPF